MRQWMQKFKQNNKGMGIIEIILIIVVMIALVVIFHDQMEDLIKLLFGKITENGTKFTSKYAG